jgi:hypothetical protein
MFDAEQGYGFDDFMSELSQRVYDPALLGSLKARFPGIVDIAQQIVASERRGEGGKPLPRIEDVTAAQCAVFDNWPEGRKTASRSPVRYVLAVEAWTAPADKIKTHRKGDYQAKALVSLMDGKAMLKKLKTLRNLSREYVEGLTDVVAGMEADDLIGLVCTKVPPDGTKYHNEQFAYVPGGICGDATTVILSTFGEMLRLPTFSTTQPDGHTKHGGAVILQSRLDVAGFSETWATPSHP